MRAQFLEGKPILNAAGGTNTGDGIRMAQHLGAALWHMWHIHGSYGFRHTDPNYPYAIRLKRFPDWFPGDAGRVKLKMPWILLDQNGNRFMSEQQPYTQDTAVRPMQYFDPVTQRFPRNPAFMVCDDEGRRLYPLGKPTSNDEGHPLRLERRQHEGSRARHPQARRHARRPGEIFSASMPRLLERKRRTMECDVRAGATSISARPPASMMRIEAPPFYGAPVWATVSNTQGGPVHDASSAIIDAFGEPIPRLYAAGELGSSFGHLYLSGGNIAECFRHRPHRRSQRGRGRAASALRGARATPPRS